MIATSINIRNEIFGTLSRAAVKLSISRRDIIVRLLMRIMRNIDKHQGGFTSVRYQPDGPGSGWHCFSIKLNPDENEFFSDLRKICKCSVSLLVAMAVEKYLNDMLEEKLKAIYNKSPFVNYIIHRELVDRVICWRIYWGVPENYPAQILA
jgi:hypothetical protein